MKTNFEFDDLKNLFDFGFTLHWLKFQDKMPVFTGWSKAPRGNWKDFNSLYRRGYNVGVRLGSVSQIGKHYLAVLDVDIKSEDPKDRKEAFKKLYELFPEAHEAPVCLSGRGNGSSHYYVLTETPISGGDRRAASSKIVRVRIPGSRINAKEEKELSTKALANGIRLRPAWEIALLSEGRQVVLPGSVHPDTGKHYRWSKGRSVFDVEMPILSAERAKSTAPMVSADGWKAVGLKEFLDVDPASLGLTDEHVEMIITGDGVTDRSAAVYSICLALARRKVKRDVVLSMLTDQRFYLGQTAFDHAGKTSDRFKAARWLDRFCWYKAVKTIEESQFDIEVSEEKKNSALRSGTSLSTEPKSWQTLLDIQSAGSGKPPVIRNTFKNVRLILDNEVGCELLKRNLFSNEDFFGCDTPWGYEEGRKRSGNNDDALRVKKWLIQTFQLEVSVNMIEEALNSIACENSFHPVKDFLESLEWDGVERVPSAFRIYLKVDRAIPEPYLSCVSRKFFQALIARIYEPGIKFDYLPVLEGKQGIGKSSFGSLLVGQDWFLDGLPDLTDKDAALNLQGVWLCEMGELSSLFRTQIESAKAFIVRQVDKVRPPYGHRRVDYARQNIFYGTTNLRDYLIDKTGNRRYWPVAVKGLDFKRLLKDRLQLLAEAKFRYDHFPEKMYLSGKAEVQAKILQENRRISDDSDSLEIRFNEWHEKQREEGADLYELQLKRLFDAEPWVHFQETMSNMRFGADVLRKAGYDKVCTKHGNVWRIHQSPTDGSEMWLDEIPSNLS